MEIHQLFMCAAFDDAPVREDVYAVSHPLTAGVFKTDVGDHDAGAHGARHGVRGGRFDHRAYEAEGLGETGEKQVVLVQTDQSIRHLPEKSLPTLKGLVVHHQIPQGDAPLHRSIDHVGECPEDGQDGAGLGQELRDGTPGHHAEAFSRSCVRT